MALTSSRTHEQDSCTLRTNDSEELASNILRQSAVMFQHLFGHFGTNTEDGVRNAQRHAYSMILCAQLGLTTQDYADITSITFSVYGKLYGALRDMLKERRFNIKNR